MPDSKNSNNHRIYEESTRPTAEIERTVEGQRQLSPAARQFQHRYGLTPETAKLVASLAGFPSESMDD